MSICLRYNDFVAEFCEKTGVLLGLVNEKTGWNIQGNREHDIFSMNVITPYCEKNTANGSMQKLSGYSLCENQLILTWNGITVENLGVLDIDFTATITAGENGIRFNAMLNNHSNYLIEHVTYPYIADLQKPGDSESFYRRNWKYGELAKVELYPHFINGYGYWANEFAFQKVTVPESGFVLVENGKEGLYAGCHDTTIPYSLQFFYELKPSMSDTYSYETETRKDDGSIKPWITFEPVHIVFTAAGCSKDLMPIVISAYTGNWQDGVEYYKKWRNTWHKPVPVPAWASKPHSWYQVQMNSYGDGLRRTYSDLPGMARKCLENGIAAIQVTGWTLQGQDGCLPCHDIDTRLGTWQDLYDAIAECEAMGVHIILYTKFNFADTRTEWFKNELHKYASRDVFGDIHSFPGYYYERPSILSGVNSHRLAIMCQNSRDWQKICCKEFQKCLDLNASGILYDEPQHHHTMYVCFDPSHGHDIPAHTFAGDLELGKLFVKQCSGAGKKDFLLAGEACYDLESTCYPFSYFRIGLEGGRTTGNSDPVQRYIDSDYQYMCGVWGYNDRNTLNYCLLYRYIISYESRQFRGDVDEFKQTLEYGRKIDALREHYADYLWYTEFLGTNGAEIRGSGKIVYAVHRSKKTGKKAVLLMNTRDDPVDCRASIAAAGKLFLVTPENPEKQKTGGDIVIPSRSAVVIAEE